MRIPLAFICLLIGSAIAHAEPASPRISIEMAEGPNPWSHLEFHDDPDNFQFAIVTDRTGRARPGVFEDAIVKLNLLQPEFVVSVGDLIQGGSTDVDRVEREWDELDGFIDHLSMPFFYVPGNHDISNPTMAEIWQRRHGRAYYHFVYKGVLFLCLNSEDPKFHIGEEQIEYFRKVLAENAEVRWTLVFLHRPFWGYSEEEIVESNWHKIPPLLEGREYTVFAGHWHDYAKYVRNDRKHFVLATTGGGSGLRGPAWGEFDHLVWVTMTDNGPVIANLMLEGIWDEDIRNEDMVVATNGALRGLAIREGSMVVDDPAAASFTAHLRIENTADVPMKVSASIEPHEFFTVESKTLETTIPPNTVENVPLSIALPDSGVLGDFGPILLDYTLGYDFPRHQPMEIVGQHAVILDRVFPLLDLPNGAVLDGDLSEWGDFPFRAESGGQVSSNGEGWTGPDDASFRFDLRSSDSHLYLAIRMVDDILYFNPDREPSVRDSLEIWIDTRSAEERTGERWDVENPPFHRVVATVTGPTTMDLVDSESHPEGLRFASSRSEGGFDLELAFPLPTMEFSEGDRDLRINIGQYDRDLEGRTESLWWRPRWDLPATFEGSGTFRRGD